ncbi:hypothetical protein AV530_010732 [Patagioenas fasciata monilis]|uniref:Uncharacterized protein n=1 Tax=Patagioenas fasciata monilis TaxID=372326 RepID=A0A1V4K7I6_PATFA|nr:hypothetical protein AV530_010732 [Patagioenas fasciata monilis]
MEKRNLLPCRRPSSASRWYQEPHRSAPNSKDMVEEKNVLQKIPQMLISLVTSTASILLMTYSQNRQQLSKPRAAGLWYFDQNIESSGKEKQNWTNFKIVLNFPVYESETDPGETGAVRHARGQADKAGPRRRTVLQSLRLTSKESINRYKKAQPVQ